MNIFRIAKPTQEEAAELEEILAKRHKRGKVVEEKPLEEKSILHSMFLCFICSNVSLLLLLFSVPDPIDYQGRNFLHPPQDVGVNLKTEAPPDRCFLPKAHIFTWKGHTKGIATVKWFPRSAHLMLSGSMDCRVKVSMIFL